MCLKRVVLGVCVASVCAAGSLSVQVAAQGIQKPDCAVSELARAAEKSQSSAALNAPDNSKDVAADQRKAAANEAQQAIARSQAEASKKFGPPKSGGFLASLFSPSNSVKASDLDL